MKKMRGTEDQSGLALLTDLYELTMAAGFLDSGKAQTEAVFHLSFREAPFKGGFTVACGLAAVIDYLRDLRFTQDDLDYLASLPAGGGKRLFSPAFLKILARFKFECDVDGVPEGTVVFPHEPLLRVRGPILQAQIIESALLNFINFQSLITTKAARVCLAAQGDRVIEFGLRRAQGPDGGLSASRAAYVGGCVATSNVLAGRRFGIPVSGTHAHSWVMAFEREPEAFAAFARTFPDNCILLVDTYNSLEGVRRAVEIGKMLRRNGHELGGIRLDSGDLAFLSVRARAILDTAGFPKAAVVASNDLDEHIIESLKQQGAAIDTWGVGTKLATAYDQPALGGVYKLSAIREPGRPWQPRLKLSEQAGKITIPGFLQVRRFRSGTEFLGDAIYCANKPLTGRTTIVDPVDPTRRKHLKAGTAFEELLVPVFRKGKLTYRSPALPEVQSRVQQQLAMLHPGIKRFVNPHEYPAGLELSLHKLRTRLILEARGERTTRGARRRRG